jgi:hypothetical protein
MLRFSEPLMELFPHNHMTDQTAPKMRLKRSKKMSPNGNKFWEELIAYITLIRHGPHRKRSVQQLLC